jgi:cation transport regulator
MSDKQLNDLPSEVKEKLPEHAQQIFQAAFNSASGDGMEEDAALRVAWNSVNQKYEQGDDGNWHRKPEDNNIHNKAIPSGGN